jgi:hypothetical protein
MMCGAKVLNEKICERTNAQDEFNATHNELPSRARSLDIAQS